MIGYDKWSIEKKIVKSENHKTKNALRTINIHCVLWQSYAHSKCIILVSLNHDVSFLNTCKINWGLKFLKAILSSYLSTSSSLIIWLSYLPLLSLSKVFREIASLLHSCWIDSYIFKLYNCRTGLSRCGIKCNLTGIVVKKNCFCKHLNSLIL